MVRERNSPGGGRFEGKIKTGGSSLSYFFGGEKDVLLGEVAGRSPE